jgi:exonuclease VII large subunit
MMNSILCSSPTAAMLALGDEEEQDLMVTSLQELNKKFGKKFEEQEKKFEEQEKKFEEQENKFEEQEKKVEEQEKKLSYLLHRKLSKQGQAKKTKMISSHNIEDDDLSFGSEGHDTEANESIELLRKEQKESFFILENHFKLFVIVLKRIKSVPAVCIVGGALLLL